MAVKKPFGGGKGGKFPNKSKSGKGGKFPNKVKSNKKKG